MPPDKKCRENSIRSEYLLDVSQDTFRVSLTKLVSALLEVGL